MRIKSAVVPFLARFERDMRHRSGERGGSTRMGAVLRAPVAPALGAVGRFARHGAILLRCFAFRISRALRFALIGWRATYLFDCGKVRSIRIPSASSATPFWKELVSSCNLYSGRGLILVYTFEREPNGRDAASVLNGAP